MVNVNINNLANEIMRGLQDYTDLTTDEVKKAVRKSANTVKKEISTNAPKDTGGYAKSWTVKNTMENSNSLKLTVHSKDHYQMAHLLEHGHAKRGGGRTRAFPHILSAETVGVEMLESEIRRNIGG